MAWSDVQPEQMVSFNDAASGGFPLNSGQSHTYTNQCMTKNDILTKYNMFSSFQAYASNQLVEKKRWSSVVFSSWFSNSGLTNQSTSGTVTIVGANVRFKAFATVQTGTDAVCTVNITIAATSRSATKTGPGTSESTTFDLGPGTYSYSVSCTITSGGVYSGGISYSVI